jgi:hypothetical protein
MQLAKDDTINSSGGRCRWCRRNRSAVKVEPEKVKKVPQGDGDQLHQRKRKN